MNTYMIYIFFRILNVEDTYLTCYVLGRYLAKAGTSSERGTKSSMGHPLIIEFVSFVILVLIVSISSS